MRKICLAFMSVLPLGLWAASITGIKADGDKEVFDLDEVVSIKVGENSTLSVRSNAGVSGGYSIIEFSDEVTKANDSNSNLEIKVYPNPVKNIIYLVGADAETKFEVVSTTGIVVMKGQGESVNVSNLASGQYVIVCDNKSVKFIKE